MGVVEGDQRPLSIREVIPQLQDRGQPLEVTVFAGAQWRRGLDGKFLQDHISGFVPKPGMTQGRGVKFSGYPISAGGLLSYFPHASSIIIVPRVYLASGWDGKKQRPVPPQHGGNVLYFDEETIHSIVGNGFNIKVY